MSRGCKSNKMSCCEKYNFLISIFKTLCAKAVKLTWFFIFRLVRLIVAGGAAVVLWFGLVGLRLGLVGLRLRLVGL